MDFLLEDYFDGHHSWEPFIQIQNIPSKLLKLIVWPKATVPNDARLYIKPINIKTHDFETLSDDPVTLRPIPAFVVMSCFFNLVYHLCDTKFGSGILHLP